MLRVLNKLTDNQTKEMKPSEYIRKGWCQGTLSRTEDGTPTYLSNDAPAKWCLMGAIQQAYDRDVVHNPVYEKLVSLLSEGVPNWNDAPGRTQQEVIDLLESIGE